MKKLLIYLLISSGALFQVENSQRTTSASIPVFYYEALNYKSTASGKTRVDVYIEVPYNVIRFVKSNDGFLGGYSISVSFFDNDKKLVTEKTWNESVTSRDFETTVSKTSFYLSLRSFMLDPNDYMLRCEVVDQDSKRNYVNENPFKVRDFSNKFNVSDLLLISKEVLVSDEKKIVPNVSRNVSSQGDGLSFAYEIYSDTLLKADIEYLIKDGDETIYKANESRDVNKSSQINYTMDNKELAMGEYVLEVDVKSSNGTVKISKAFFSRWVGVPSSVKDLDKAIDQMVYIARDSEIDYIKEGATREEKLNRYLEYWKKKDPSPSTEENEVFEEYYRRILYSNEHFKHYTEGWRTDMGMIYVTLGPPNNVERHPFEFDSKPYEVWDYYDINKRFIFIDETGFGDYRLVTPVYGNWWKYRQ